MVTVCLKQTFVFKKSRYFNVHDFLLSEHLKLLFINSTDQILRTEMIIQNAKMHLNSQTFEFHIIIIIHIWWYAIFLRVFE